MSPEFSRPVPLERIGAEGFEITVTADTAECTALAARMHLPAIQSLSCRFRLRPEPGGGYDARGALRAAVTQTCVISLDEFPATVAEDFAIRFVPTGTETEEDDPESVDEVVFAGTTIDLGEAVAEQLALALDPYPRKPGAELHQDSGASGENPFARLAALRREH